MKTIISSNSKIREVYNLFVNQVRTNDLRRIQVIQHKREVYWNSSYGIWYCNEDSRKPKPVFMNRFGLTQMSDNNRYAMIIEFNIYKTGINRQYQGILLVDSMDRYFLGHRGNLGNHKGSVFRSNEFNEYREKVIDGEKHSEILIVGQIGSEDFLQKLSFFINKIKDYSDLLKKV